MRERRQFNIKCECIIMRDNLPLNKKKKSKFSHVSLEAESGCLSIVPFGTGK